MIATTLTLTAFGLMTLAIILLGLKVYQINSTTRPRNKALTLQGDKHD